MTTSNVAVDKTAKTAPAKLSEKILEKRRALGRGLESLLPGPRVVTPPPAEAKSQVSGVRSQESESAVSSAENPDGPGRPSLRRLPPMQSICRRRRTRRWRAIARLTCRWIGSSGIRTRRGWSSILKRCRISQVRFRHRECCNRSWCGRCCCRVAEKPRFVLILGERRFRASKMAGKTTIPAMVKRVSEQQAAEMTLVENLQRQDLDCLEQAAAFSHLSTEFGLTQDQIGKRVGVSREQVSNYLRLLKLPPTVIGSLRKKELTFSHARLLLSLQDDAHIAKVAHMVVAKKMSVALLEDMILDLDVPRPGKIPSRAGRAGSIRM